MEFLKTLPPDKPEKKPRKPAERRAPTKADDMQLLKKLRELAPKCRSLLQLSKESGVAYTTLCRLRDKHGLEITSPTDEIVERALEEAALNPQQTLRQVADKLGVPHNHLHNSLKRRNVVLDLHVVTTADEVKRLAEQGLYACDIARELGISKQRISQIVHEHKIQLCGNARYRKKKGTMTNEPRLGPTNRKTKGKKS